MSISYSHSEWFVPRLDELMKPDHTSVRRCVWHKSRRAPKKDGGHLVRCSCPIAESDAKKADQLLEDVRTALDRGDGFQELFQKLSSLLLCRKAHRLSNAEVISDFWAAELETRKPVQQASKQTSRPSTPQTSIYRVPLPEVLDQLGITIEQRIKCHGKGQRLDRCGNWINKSNGERIAAISRELAEDWRLSNKVLELLEELSGLILCQRWHQYQAPTRLKDWITAIKSKEESLNTPQAHKMTNSPHTPTKQTTQTPEIETPETRTSPFWSPPRRPRTPESALTTPSSILSLDRPNIHSPLTYESRRAELDRLREQSCVSPTPVSSRTRSMDKDRSEDTTVLANKPRTFEPLPTVKSPLKAAEHVMKKIKQKISSAEKVAGFIYGFRRPGCELIKIGMTTKTVAERLKGIGTKCNYKPSVVFEVATNHAMKVEHLVHRQLYRQNRRECLVNELCNEGRGCSTQHREWFEGVSDEYAELVVRAWVRWINLEPYDSEGCLKKPWFIHAKLFDLSAPGDIWLRWTEISLVKVIKKEAEEDTLDAAIKAEKVLSTVCELSSQQVVPKLEVSSTAKEIRDLSSDLVVPVSHSSPVDVFV